MGDVCNYPFGDGKYCANDAGAGHIYCAIHRQGDPLAQQIDEEPVMTPDPLAELQEQHELHRRHHARFCIPNLCEMTRWLSLCDRLAAVSTHQTCNSAILDLHRQVEETQGLAARMARADVAAAEHERDRALEQRAAAEHQLDKATAALEDTLRRWSEMSQAPPNPLMVMQLARGEVARIVAALAPQPGAEE